jgi:hypothetical protein
LGQSGNGDVFIARYRPDGSLSWAVSAGGSESSDWCWDIAAGNDGSVFGAGEFYSSIMDFGSGVTISKVGLSDSWVAKWDSAVTIVWARAFWAGNSDEAFGVTSDDAGNCYIRGALIRSVLRMPRPALI